LVLVSLRPERPDRTVDHARRQDRALGRSSLTLEKTAGNLPCGVHPLLDVDREREEVRALARLLTAHRRREHHRLAGPRDDGAVGLLRELAGLEREVLLADGHADRCEAFGGNRHGLSLHFPSRESGDSSQRRRRRSLESPLPSLSRAWLQPGLGEPFRYVASA